jgi:hypothetical protein
LHEPSGFFVPRAKPRVPGAAETRGAAARTAAATEVKNFIMADCVCRRMENEDMEVEVD